MTEINQNEIICANELLTEFPISEYHWNLLHRNNLYFLQNKTIKEDLIFIKELCINNKEKDITTYKQIYKEIYFSIKLKNYSFFSKKVDFKISKDKNYVFLISRGNTVSLSKLISSKKYDYLKKKQFIKNIICQIANGLYFIHSNNIIHHDIKSSNIVINENGIVSIIDFGSAMFKNEESYDYTLCYTSPEFLIDQKSSEKYDMWGLGVIMLELYLRKNIFNKKGIEKMKDQINYILQQFCIKYKYSNEYLNKDLDFNKDIKFKFNKEILDKIGDENAIELIYNLLSFNPEKRPSAKEVLFESEYLKEFRDKINLKIKKIEYPQDYKKISSNIKHEEFIELLENIKKI